MGGTALGASGRSNNGLKLDVKTGKLSLWRLFPTFTFTFLHQIQCREGLAAAGGTDCSALSSGAAARSDLFEFAPNYARGSADAGVASRGSAREVRVAALLLLSRHAFLAQNGATQRRTDADNDFGAPHRGCCAQGRPMAEAEVALPHGPPPPSPYRSAAGRAALHAHYNKALAALPYQHEEKLVETSFGTAHVLVCGPADAPPLVLWHGMAVPGPFMIRTLDPLVQHYRVYAPDHPFQGELMWLACIPLLISRRREPSVPLLAGRARA